MNKKIVTWQQVLASYRATFNASNTVFNQENQQLNSVINKFTSFENTPSTYYDDVLNAIYR